MNFIPDSVLEAYKANQKFTLAKHVARIEKLKYNGKLYELYMGQSSVFSSRIEGSTVTENDYTNFKTLGIGKGTDRINEVLDLQKAYEYARANPLNRANLLKAHRISSKTILRDVPAARGSLRTVSVNVGNIWRVVYRCPAPENARKYFDSFMRQMAAINTQKITTTEAFYYAAMIHLMFVKIHPFQDGNGRLGRLLEKWFLAHHIGATAWFIQTEKHYYQNREIYYKHLSALGEDFESINLRKAVPFLLMLPRALRDS